MKTRNPIPSVFITAALLTQLALPAADAPMPRPDGKPADMTKKVKVFILLGQSNMVGAGKVKGGDGSLEYAVKEKKKHYPGAKGYEVAGFFFWQGERDAGNAGHAAHYEENLVRFIKAVRKEFNAPDAKFVLGTIGESVKGSGGNGGKVLEGHLNVDGTSGKYPEFKGNVATIYTHPMAQGGSGNGHYGGKAEVYMDVGEAMGKAMVELLGKSAK